MQASVWFHCSFCTLYLKSPQNYFVTSLLLARNFLLASLFSFQGACSNLLQGQIEMLGLLTKHFNLISLVEVTGLEPVTPCLQSRCSTSRAKPPDLFGGGPKWTRTTDLTIISRAL